ncbi:MAG: hypothetical protein ACOX5Z_02715 [Desulfobulbus sp.]|jgi:hypothetical protein
MEMQQTISADQRNGNLHLSLHGRFTPEIAMQLGQTIADSYIGRGNIFIHTSQVTEVASGSRHAFGRMISDFGLPHDKMYLIGARGLDIGPDTTRVIIYEKKKRGCCGKCRSCACGGEHAHPSHTGKHQEERGAASWARQ